MGRWYAVGGIGLASGAFLGWLVWALTASAPAALVVGGAVAAILVVLAVGGARQGAAFAVTDQRVEVARARRDRVRAAMRETRERPGK